VPRTMKGVFIEVNETVV